MGNKQSYNLKESHPTPNNQADIAYTYDTARGINMKSAMNNDGVNIVHLEMQVDDDEDDMQMYDADHVHVLRRIQPLPHIPLPKPQRDFDEDDEDHTTIIISSS